MTALIPTFHAVINVLVRNRPQRLVVQRDQPHSFPQIFLEVLNFLQFMRLRGLFLPVRSDEKLLVTAIGEGANFVAHHHPGALRKLREAAITFLRHTGDAVPFDAGFAASGRVRTKPGRAGSAQMVVKREGFGDCAAEEHSFLRL